MNTTLSEPRLHWIAAAVIGAIVATLLCVVTIQAGVLSLTLRFLSAWLGLPQTPGWKGDVVIALCMQPFTLFAAAALGYFYASRYFLRTALLAASVECLCHIPLLLVAGLNPHGASGRDAWATLFDCVAIVIFACWLVGASCGAFARLHAGRRVFVASYGLLLIAAVIAVGASPTLLAPAPVVAAMQLPPSARGGHGILPELPAARHSTPAGAPHSAISGSMRDEAPAPRPDREDSRPPSQ
jgi:hypothetical protein